MEDSGVGKATLEGKLFAYERLLIYILWRLPEEEFNIVKTIMLDEASYPEATSPAGLILFSECRQHGQWLITEAEKWRRALT
jgi:hypothetical protein